MTRVKHTSAYRAIELAKWLRLQERLCAAARTYDLRRLHQYAANTELDAYVIRHLLRQRCSYY